MLLMKKEFFEAIHQRRKTTTFRCWRRPMVTAGSVHRVRGLGVIRVEDITPVTADMLTDADAQADGYADVAALQDALDELYSPQQRGERTLYRVCFAFGGEDGRAAGPSPKCS